jgi:outer membrane protein TolC
MFGAHGWRLVLLLVAVLLAGQSAAQERPKQRPLNVKKITKILGRHEKPASRDADELKNLLADRLAVAQSAYLDTAQNYQQGLATEADVMRASRRLWAAELATKSTPQERIAVLEKAVAVEQENEQAIRQAVDLGGRSPVELTNARYDLLTAQINLVKARMQVRGPERR